MEKTAGRTIIKRDPNGKNTPKESLFFDYFFDFILLSAPFCDFSEIKSSFCFSATFYDFSVVILQNLLRRHRVLLRRPFE